MSPEEARQGGIRTVTVRRSRPCTLCCATGRLGPCLCDLCRGTGRTGRTQIYEVFIPADVTEGQRLRLTERHGPRPGNGAAGDVFLRVRLAKSPGLSADDQRPQELEHSTREQAQETARLQSALRAEASARRQAERAVADLSATKARLERELGQRNQVEAQRKRDLESAQAQMRTPLEALAPPQQELETTASQLQLAQVRVASLEQERAALAAQLAETRQSHAMLQTNLGALQRELRAKQRLIQQEQARRQDLERQLRQLTNRRVARETRIQEAKCLADDANRGRTEPSGPAQVQLELQLSVLPGARQELEGIILQPKGLETSLSESVRTGQPPSRRPPGIPARARPQEAAAAEPLHRASGLKPGHKAKPAIRRLTSQSPARRSNPFSSPWRTKTTQDKRPRLRRSDPAQLYHYRAAPLPRLRPARWPGAMAPVQSVKPRPSAAPNRVAPPPAARKKPWWQPPLTGWQRLFRHKGTRIV